MAEKSFFDELFKGVADAVADIREKVVEEPWFGKTVTEREAPAPEWPQAREAETAGSHLEQLRERDAAKDHEMER